MKKILLLFTVVFTSFSTFAQDPQLFENDWYLQKVVIDGEDFFPPYPIDEPVDGRIYFVDDVTDELITSFCDDLAFQIINFDATVFNLLDDPIILPGFCILEENTTYASIYGAVFRNQATSAAKNPFNYSISTVNNVTILVITNGDGDVVIYGDELLSNQNFNKDSVTLYPNPVTEVMQIHTENNVVVKKVQVYNILGEKILETYTTNQLDVSKLATGLLFVKIETANGFLVKKVVKE